MSPETYLGKTILVIWAPAGDVRPYQAPVNFKGPERAYFIRQGSETVQARDETLTQLFQLTAKVPFDDRRNPSVGLDIISPSLVRNFLTNINSNLVAPGVNIPDQTIYQFLRITAPINSHEVPKNIALLFFVNDPEQFFPGARIEVVQFGDDAGGDLIEEKIFRGPLNLQIHQALDYLNSFSTAMLQKVPNQAEIYRSVAFPYEAMEEALVNAIFHRSYEGIQEPTKVYLYPDRMEIISYPGPVPGIEMKHLQPGGSVPPVPNRNRRIGDFLKDLRLAEARGTGIPKIRRKMVENGSPQPTFEFDDTRTYFRVILPAHPQYIVIQSLRESSRLWATGERQRAIQNLVAAQKRVPQSGAITAQLIDYFTSLGDFSEAEKLFRECENRIDLVDRHLPFIAMARAYLDHREDKRANEILAKIPTTNQPTDLIELAVLNKRSGRLEEAHRIFASNFEMIRDNPKAVHEFAQTKMKIAGQTQEPTRSRLNREAAELLRRAIQLSEDSTRCAWCWFDLARVLGWLKAPENEVSAAYEKAVDLLPTETRFKQDYNNWKQKKHSI